jgi:hypothetical protein
MLGERPSRCLDISLEEVLSMADQAITQQTSTSVTVFAMLSDPSERLYGDLLTEKIRLTATIY